MMNKEFIEREALIKITDARIAALEKEYGFFDHYKDGYAECASRIEDAPTADVVEVVRCKDCCFYKSDTDYCRENNKGYCVFDSVIKPKNHFCGYGDRNGEG